MNVLMSDADALWLADPKPYFDLAGAMNSSIVASRGSFPTRLGRRWGATMCMGFILFRSTGQNMRRFIAVLSKFVLETKDDQISVNSAAEDLGIVWDQDNSDMRYAYSTGLGLGTIFDPASNEELLNVALLPHSAFTRLCETVPISNGTIVAHCHSAKAATSKRRWMKRAHMWFVSEAP